MMNDLISKLSDLRSQYNCFDESERNAYDTLSEAIKALSAEPEKSEEYDPDSWPVISLICFVILIIGFAISAIF